MTVRGPNPEGIRVRAGGGPWGSRSTCVRAVCELGEYTKGNASPDIFVGGVGPKFCGTVFRY